MPSRHLKTVRAIGFVVVVAALVVMSSPGLRGSKNERHQRRAHLSADLSRHQERRTSARTRVIVHGTSRELDVLASRHRLRVVKRMRGAAVVLVNSAELSDLSRDVDRLSGDLPRARLDGDLGRVDGGGSDARRKRAAGRVARHSGRGRAGHRRRGRRFRDHAALGARQPRRRERELRQPAILR